jgi:hypothetical protein
MSVKPEKFKGLKHEGRESAASFIANTKLRARWMYYHIGQHHELRKYAKTSHC